LYRVALFLVIFGGGLIAIVMVCLLAHDMKEHLLTYFLNHRI